MPISKDEADELAKLVVALHSAIKLGPKRTPEEHYRETSCGGKSVPRHSWRTEIPRKFSIANEDSSIARNLHSLTRRLLAKARDAGRTRTAAILQGFLTLMEAAMGQACFDPAIDEKWGEAALRIAVNEWIEGDPSAREKRFEEFQARLISIGESLGTAIAEDLPVAVDGIRLSQPMTLGELGRLFARSPATIGRWIKTEKLVAKRIDRQNFRIREEDIPVNPKK